MSEGLLHGLKKVMEDALAFEHGDHRDLKIIPMSGSASVEGFITSAHHAVRGSQMIASGRAVCYKTIYERST
jgi:hypothetical protein